MTVIHTYKCDGCGAITRSYPDEWFHIAIERKARHNRKSIFDFSGKDTLKRDACSPACAAVALTAAREEIDALEIPA